MKILSKNTVILGWTFFILIFLAMIFSPYRDFDLLLGFVFILLMSWVIVTSKKQEFESKQKVSELQSVQKDLLQTQKALKDAIKSRDEFLSIASHELKNPMTILKLQTQQLQRQLKRARNLNDYRPKIEQAMDKFNEQVSALNRLIEDMLDISRLKTGKLKIIPYQCDMGELIFENVNTFSEQMKLEGYPPAVVILNGNLMGNWDKMRLSQVLNNLMSNAIRYGNQNTITIKAEELNDKIRVSISDNGIGISKEDQLRIFEKFERATLASEERGLGLGLYITFNIISAHKGKLWVESEPGKGSTFSFELPKK